MVLMVIIGIVTLARKEIEEDKWAHLKPSDEAITNSSH